MSAPNDITRWSAAQIAARVAGREVRAEEVARAHLERISGLDKEVGAFITVLEESSLAQAREVDRRIAAGEAAGRLSGVPVAIKDNMLMEGTETTCGSRILKGYRAPYDATVVGRLKAAGAVIIGKTNLDEFAMGSSTENSSFFPTRNPWALDRVPGGSSGGSAAAVAAGMAALSLGSDTGGSIRQPAALCGIVGLKPTYGLVSRYGLVAFASSLDQIGPFARTTEDAALALSVLAGHDPLDSTSAEVEPRDYLRELEGRKDLKGLRVGVPKEYFIEGMEPDAERSVREGLKTLEELGARTCEVSLPHTRFAVSTYYLIAPAEASSNLARFDGVRYGSSEARQDREANLLSVYERTRGEGFGPEVKRRIMLGTYALSSGYYDAYYGKAQRVRTLIRQDFDEAFQSVDILASPTSPSAAFRLGEKSGDPMQMYLSDIFTIPCNLAGNAGISIPCGLTSAGLPVGLQLLAPTFEEGRLFQVSRVFERARPFPVLDAR
ncbi:MAG: Asp-tRNA(Asn)/Glu-tRNA(Gln) amidotransferase subunit GatA [Elusimicrobia bacterium]|nr:Asp-tRNA(Asn)/Glu-tRNA(Gln) amidotransferase subunit GatA [Elusimicrobiota bacterium]